ncbi:MAG: gamma-glutamyltransferase family protein [Anaerolineaceae bacterium]
MDSLPFDLNYFPYPSRRFPLTARNGMVNASQPQASSAGLQVLLKGGNAVDAAVAAATTLTVVEPTANGIGSDAFALVWIEKEQKLYGLNASGWAPEKLNIEKVKEVCGQIHMPSFGWLPTIVPGAPAAWAALSDRFGRVGLEKTMEPAIQYARAGYPVSPSVSDMWQRAAKRYSALNGDPVYQGWFETFLIGGEAPQSGQLITLPYHADTLSLIANTHARAFYAGELTDKILRDSQGLGGFFTFDDFAKYQVDWVEPISVNYRGYTVCEIPPNGQGITALMALNILNNFSLTNRENERDFHLHFEAMKLAFSDARHFVTDPRYMTVSPDALLSERYGRTRANQITEQAALPEPCSPPGSGTVYLCTADGEGNMVSYIQSNYMGFGSGIVIRGTGIALQNRGADFSLDSNEPNCFAPRKKTYHTIIPGFLMKDEKAIGPFGVMGGYMQPQGHVQVITNLLDYHLNPQQALDAPRWQWMRDRQFAVEYGFSPALVHQLLNRGHKIDMFPDSTSFGRGQIIWKLGNGVMIGGTEGRTDSNIACY